MTNPQLILIDLDGTLVDSVPDLAFCVDAMMQALGLPPHGGDKVRGWVGNGIERLVCRALVGTLDGEPDESLFNKAFPMFLELYAENTSKRSTVYPGVREGLDHMKTAGYSMGCVTNKAGNFTTTLLKELGLADYFELVISGDSLPKKKPDPLPLLHAAKRFGISPANSLMVGDSINDVEAARAAGFQVVCVNYGYNHGRDIREAAPDAVIDSLAELASTL